MANSILSVRMEPDVKQSFLRLCDELGLTASAVVNALARQMLREKALPFVPSLEVCQTDTALTIDRIGSSVRRAAAGYPEIESVTLFGSYARGEANASSDVDLRVACRGDSRGGLLRLSSFAASVEAELGRHVDVISADDLPQPWVDVIAHEGVTLYERA